ncbi:MAG: glycosyltransferase [Cyclobacteriaceae bacterium]|jgi:glycosyltransferase involved in cell wall biosynthesis|nr:glycosyltransferase [Cyclobacteriaceae bacterium]
MHVKRLLIYCPYPLHEAPSQRFRFEQYLHLPEKQGVKITTLTFYNQSAWKILYSPGKRFLKSACIGLSLLKRFVHLFYALQADRILIHREMLPIGPPILEWVLARLLRKKIIYDFDDAIWLTDNSNESKIEKFLRWRSKVALICRWSHKVSAGNEYLADYARKFNKNVVINPTTIDTEKHHNRVLYQETSHPHARDRSDGKIIIGWTGSHTTLKYLEGLYPVLKKLEEQHPQIIFMVIADQPSTMPLKNLVFKKWTTETEITDLLLADIGIMPLPDDEWSKGKCGFKALQYMALEIPCLASPVGVNTTIIQHGVNGFHCQTEEDWLTCFDKLISNPDLRRQLGRAGRKTVEEHYSVNSNTSTFLSLFE